MRLTFNQIEQLFDELDVDSTVQIKSDLEDEVCNIHIIDINRDCNRAYTLDSNGDIV